MDPSLVGERGGGAEEREAGTAAADSGIIHTAPARLRLPLMGPISTQACVRN